MGVVGERGSVDAERGGGLIGEWALASWVGNEEDEDTESPGPLAICGGAMDSGAGAEVGACCCVGDDCAAVANWVMIVARDRECE
jgi:hypothetical protein